MGEFANRIMGYGKNALACAAFFGLAYLCHEPAKQDNRVAYRLMIVGGAASAADAANEKSKLEGKVERAPVGAEERK